MKTQASDWTRWGEQWRTQPGIDVAHLRAQARRKLLRMRLMVGVELLATALACGQLVWMLLWDETTWRWKIWAGCTLAFLIGLEASLLWVRRHTWSVPADSMAALLELGLKRARAGLRLARLNAGGLAVVVAASLLAAWPWLDPQRWQADPHLKLLVLVQCAANLPVVVIGFAFCAWYARAQKRRIAALEALLRGERSAESEPAARVP